MRSVAAVRMLRANVERLGKSGGYVQPVSVVLIKWTKVALEDWLPLCRPSHDLRSVLRVFLVINQRQLEKKHSSQVGYPMAVWLPSYVLLCLISPLACSCSFCCLIIISVLYDSEPLVLWFYSTISQITLSPLVLSVNMFLETMAVLPFCYLSIYLT